MIKNPLEMTHNVLKMTQTVLGMTQGALEMTQNACVFDHTVSVVFECSCIEATMW